MMKTLRTALALSVVCAPATDLVAQGYSLGSYGSSCPGGSTTPQTCVVLDAAGMTLYLHGAAPLQFSALLAGMARANTPVGGSCRLLVQPQIAVPAVISLAGRVDWRLPSPLNPDPSWLGLEFCFQHLVADAAGPALGGGFVMTNGFSVRFF